MSYKKPNALRIAAVLDIAANALGVSDEDDEIVMAAAELRRLHALCDEMSEALNALLFLINRDAPQLSGKTIGYAQTALAKWKESK